VNAFAEQLSAALAKLPPTAETTFRGGNVTPAAMVHHRPGTVLFEPGFTSTSRDLRVATENLTGDLLVSITGVSGRDLTVFSAYPDEAEVVFDRGAYFRVLVAGPLADTSKHALVLVETARPDVSRGLSGAERAVGRNRLDHLVAEYRLAVGREAVPVTSPGKFTALLGLDRTGTPFVPSN
jgi:NAD:arginine ADP-ribosyltransferase.